MKKTFNIAGPCCPAEHYMLPTQERCVGLINLIDHRQYFVIHAARQSGKTTLLLELSQQLNEAGEYYALYCSLETVQGIDDPKEGIPAIINVIKSLLKFHQTLKPYSFADQVDYGDFNVALMEAFSYFCEQLDKPLVVLFDEIDCLSNGTLISFLQQLRNGYINRSLMPFVHSIALVGMRNICDYKGKIRKDPDTLGSASPFYIVKTSKTLRHFTKELSLTVLLVTFNESTMHQRVGSVFLQPTITQLLTLHHSYDSICFLSIFRLTFYYPTFRKSIKTSLLSNFFPFSIKIL